jgi:ankyrin repeat protein
VRVLLEARAGVNLATRDGNTAMHLACLAGEHAAVRSMYSPM